MYRASRCCIQYVSKSGRPSSGHKTGKGNPHPISKKGSTKAWASHRTIALISHASKVMLKILHARFQQYVNQELPDVQAGFRQSERNQRSNCQHLLDHRESKGIPEKHLLLFHRLHQSL